MPQSLSLVIVHLVLSTKDRLPRFDAPLRPHLHAYLAEGHGTRVVKPTASAAWPIMCISPSVSLAP